MGIEKEDFDEELDLEVDADVDDDDLADLFSSSGDDSMVEFDEYADSADIEAKRYWKPRLEKSFVMTSKKKRSNNASSMPTSSIF